MWTYTIRSGDTLSALAGRFGTTVSALAAANNISNPNSLMAGSNLRIPEGFTPLNPRPGEPIEVNLDYSGTTRTNVDLEAMRNSSNSTITKFDVLMTTGNDTVNGSGVVDRILGDNGNDVINGKSGDDLLYGGNGNDKLHGGWGADRISGGAGADTWTPLKTSPFSANRASL